MDGNLEKILSAPVSEETVVFNVEGLNLGNMMPSPEEQNSVTEPKDQGTEEPNPNTEPGEEKNKVVNTSGITNFIKSNIKDGKWQDLEIEDPEGNIVKVSDMEDISEDMFNLIYQEQEKIKQESFEKDYLSVKGLTEVQRSLIDLVKVGGESVAETIKNNPDSVNPLFYNEDLQSEESQIRVFVQDYMMKGVSQQDAENLAKMKMDSGDLYGEAHEIKTKHYNNFIKEVEDVKASILEQQKQSAEQEKIYKKDLKQTFLENGYNPAKVDKLVETATKKEGDRFVIDDLYYQMMTNPKTAYKLIEFLVDPENFANRIKKQATTEANLDTLSTIRRVSLPTKTTTSSKTEVATDAPVFHFKSK